MTSRVNKIAINDLNSADEPFIYQTEIKDLLIIKRPHFPDSRGSFQELYRTPDIEKLIGREVKLKQGALAESDPNVLKGIHAEPQDKVIIPLTGKLIAVIVDLRVDSKTFKDYIMVDFDISDEAPTRASLFIPKGCGNSYYVYKKSRRVFYQYAVSETYDPSTREMGVRFDDGQLNISWPENNPILSERDKNMPSLSEFLERFR